MGKANDDYEALLNEYLAESKDPGEIARDRSKALYDLANDLTYPVDQSGNQLNIHWLIPILAPHLEKCGYRKHPELATITQVPHPRRGHAQVADDAVLYVPVDAPGTIPKVFIPTPEEQPSDPINDQWLVKTHITLDGESIKGSA